MPAGRVATLEDEGLFLPDPETGDSEPPKFDQIEGLSMWMTQAIADALCVARQITLLGIVHIMRPSTHGTRSI